MFHQTGTSVTKSGTSRLVSDHLDFTSTCFVDITDAVYFLLITISFQNLYTSLDYVEKMKFEVQYSTL